MERDSPTQEHEDKDECCIFCRPRDRDMKEFYMVRMGDG